MDTTQPSPLSFREVLQRPAFRRLWLAQLVSLFGDFLALFAVLSVASFKLHATPRQITLITVAFLIPFAFIGPLSGVFVDRWDLKRTMITSDLLRSGLALMLVFVGNLYGIYAILMALSIVSTFFVPAQSVTLRTVVPPHGLLAANALMQQALQVVRIVSPALAGALVGWFGASICYYVDTSSFLFSATMIAPLVIRRAQAEPAKPGQNSVRGVVTDFGTGTKFIFTHANISFVIIAITAGMFAISCFGPLLAVFVRDQLKADEVTFGIINALLGVGMIVCTLLINRFARHRAQTFMVIEGLLAIGLAVVVMATFRNVTMAGVGMFGVGIGSALIMIPSQTLIQRETPMQMVGRVSSSVWSLLCIAQVVGLVFSGSLAQRFGVVTLFYFSAALLVLIAAVGYFRLLTRAEAAPVTVKAADGE